MTYERLGGAGLDYLSCRYGTSRVLCRGPKADLSGPYVTYLGGTATYGKFIPRPFPSIVEARTRFASVNLGVVNAGPDLYLGDRALLSIAAAGKATVVQLPGVPNLSNRYYSVHARRNDRFLQASALLKTVYREVDFASFHFTRHMLQTLQAMSTDRFAILVAELQEAWIGRMRRLIKAVRGPVVLLWFANEAIPDTCDPKGGVIKLGDHMLVDRAMIGQVMSDTTELVEVVASEAAQSIGTEGMVFSQMEAAAAHRQPGVLAHVEAAEALEPVLDLIVGSTAWALPN